MPLLPSITFRNLEPGNFVGSSEWFLTCWLTPRNILRPFWTSIMTCFLRNLKVKHSSLAVGGVVFFRSPAFSRRQLSVGDHLLLGLSV